MKEVFRDLSFVLSIIIAAIAAIPIGYVWLELLGRTFLFIVYGCHPSCNHVADDYFVTIPHIASGGFFIGLISFFYSLMAYRRILIIITGLVILSALIAPLYLEILHKNRMLVSYEEFLKVC